MRAVFGGDAGALRAAFAEAASIRERYHDPELTTLARIGLSRCLIYLQEIGQGLALLDEALIAVERARSRPSLSVTDCTGIEGCQELFEVRPAEV